jgi:hypothetical protein
MRAVLLSVVALMRCFASGDRDRLLKFPFGA